MAISFTNIEKELQKLDIDDDVIITGNTSLAIYGINNKYIQKPYDIVNNESIFNDKYNNLPFTDRIYEDDIFEIDNKKITSPGKAIIDVLLQSNEGDMYELLEYIQNTPYEVTTKSYVQKYNLTEIIKNIIKNYNLEDFSDVLLEE